MPAGLPPSREDVEDVPAPRYHEKRGSLINSIGTNQNESERTGMNRNGSERILERIVMNSGTNRNESERIGMNRNESERIGTNRNESG